jgi:PilZ domain
MTTRTERRTQSRKRPFGLVYVEIPPANGGMMRDLSEQGFALRAMLPLRQAEKVPFSFILDSSARIDGDAIVVRVDDEGHVAALEYAGLPVHSRDMIRHWLEKFDEPAPKAEAPATTDVATNSTFEELRTEIRTTEPRPAVPPVQQLEFSEPAAAPEASPIPALIQPPPEPSQTAPTLNLSSVRPEPAKRYWPTRPPALENEEPEKLEVASEISPPLPHTLPVLAPPRPTAPLVSEVAAQMDTTGPGPSRVAQPVLEPLSSLEGETDAPSPGWMDRFTLSRAIGIMLTLTLVAGSFVYHRELGHALVWLGQIIAGEGTTESLQPVVVPQPVPAAAASNPEIPPATNPSASAQSTDTSQPAESTADSSAPASTQIPSASEVTPSPRLKDSTSPSLVPLTQQNHQPATPAPTEAPVDPGQQEYQQALAILRAPNREADVPNAVQLLWTSVEKGNKAAEIALAELYRTGRGVSRNCAQAKILLSTAARKGSAEAQKRLEELQTQGCGD